jgi:hypothetical protein
MAITNQERVGKAMELLRAGLAPFWDVAALLGIDAVLKDGGVTKLSAVKRVVLVGNKISPGNPVTKADGTVVRTLSRAARRT